MPSSPLPSTPLVGGALLAALLAGLAVPPAAAQPAAVDAQAQLLAPPGSEQELKATASLPVTALPTAPHQPVRMGALLVAVDVSKLEKELAEVRKTLAEAQTERRERQVDQPVVRGGGGGGGGAGSGQMQELQFTEANAMTELVELQTRITTAPLFAPADGYVVRHLYAVGATAKKRKPILVFVEASKTVLEARVPADQAGPFTAGAEVRVASMIDPAQVFLGRVESAAPAGETVSLRIRPSELPFLTLGTSTPVTLSPVR